MDCLQDERARLSSVGGIAGLLSCSPNVLTSTSAIPFEASSAVVLYGIARMRGRYTDAHAKPLNVELYRAPRSPLCSQPDPLSSKRAAGDGGDVQLVVTGTSAARLVPVRSRGGLTTPDRSSTEPLSSLGPRRMRSSAPGVCAAAFGGPAQAPPYALQVPCIQRSRSIPTAPCAARVQKV